MSQENSTNGLKVIFACSGSSDVGAIADQAARRLTKDGAGKMFCAAGIAGRIKVIMEKTQTASKILAIDGCAVSCVKNMLQLAGFDKFEHLILSDLGMIKGKSPLTDENISKAAQKGKELIA
jgi:uncharacterized metal-binding protein